MTIAIIILCLFILTWIGFIFFGLKKMKWSKIISIGGGFIVACFVFIFISGIVYLNEPPTPVSPEKARKELIDRNFSAWDGSHRKLEKYIKESMNDPISYEHIETRYWDRGDNLVVQTTFRGKNAFGGVVKNSVKAKVALDGSILEIIESN